MSENPNIEHINETLAASFNLDMALDERQPNDYDATEDVQPPNLEAQSEGGLLGRAALAVRGLRLNRLENKKDRLTRKYESKTQTVEAHKEMPDVFSNTFQDSDSKWNPPSALPASKRVDAPGATPRMIHRDAQDIVFNPVTFSERRQELRAGRRQGRANEKRIDTQHRLQQVWGADIGTDAFVQRIRSSRMRSSDKRRAMADHRKYVRVENKATKLEGKVKRSARGEDIPGRYHRKRQKKTQKKLNKTIQKIDSLRQQ